MMIAVGEMIQGTLKASFVTSVFVNLFLAGSLNTLFMAMRWMQIMVHMMLVKVQVPANATIFYGLLL